MKTWRQYYIKIYMLLVFLYLLQFFWSVPNKFSSFILLDHSTSSSGNYKCQKWRQKVDASLSTKKLTFFDTNNLKVTTMLTSSQFFLFLLFVLLVPSSKDL